MYYYLFHQIFVISIGMVIIFLWSVSYADEDKNDWISYYNKHHTQSIQIDLKQIQAHRIQKVNNLRKNLWLSGYIVHDLLNQTAQIRSDHAKTLWMISHRRTDSRSYYNYSSIVRRFAGQDIIFSGKGTLVVENIWYWYVKCKRSDCTQDLLQAIESTRIFFISEKYKKHQPHYRSMINPSYKFAGIWVSIDLDAQKYYLTAHYSQLIHESNVWIQQNKN